jgi:tryptophanyl-tRNA synthetase
MAKKRILSGMRPTGPLHIGNLVGALQNWAALQDEFECFYMVADWHALMSEYKDPSEIRGNSIEVAADWIAAGLDPKRSTLFVQSDVPEHIELAMILGCITPVSWLERCPTYKEQVEQLAEKEVANYAFLGYPVLQAADIILYRANYVPVGEDQLPHLELTREITRRFNTMYGDVFPEPKAKLTPAARLLGLDCRKMSKSYGNQINIGEHPDSIRKKVMTMFTDPKRVKRNDPGHPDECNLFAWNSIFSPNECAALSVECKSASIGCVDCKKKLAETLVNFLEPIRKRREEITSDRGELKKILDRGAAHAREIAKETMEAVHKAMRY